MYDVSEKLKINLEGTTAEVKAVLRALAYYASDDIEFPATVEVKTCEGDCNCKNPETETAPKPEKKTRTKKEKEAPVTTPEVSEPVAQEAPVQEVTETPEAPKMPEVQPDLTPAKELEPAPTQELAEEVSQASVLRELQGYCVRKQGKYPQRSEEEIKAMSRALCFTHGGSETGLKGVPAEKYQSVINAAQEDWEPDTDSFGEL